MRVYTLSDMAVGKKIACIHGLRSEGVNQTIHGSVNRLLTESRHPTATQTILNKIINAPCGTLKLLLALGVAKYIKSHKIHFVVQYATDYCPLEHDNYKTISAHLGSPISCYINNLHGAFIFLLSVDRRQMAHCVYIFN